MHEVTHATHWIFLIYLMISSETTSLSKVHVTSSASCIKRILVFYPGQESAVQGLPVSGLDISPLAAPGRTRE
jgi:hypothetical protein